MTIKCLELNWLRKHMKKVRSSQASISINSCTELSKTVFPCKYPFKLIHDLLNQKRETCLFMYLCDLFFIFFSSFSLWLIVKSHEYRHICSFTYFLHMPHYFSMIMWMKNVNNLRQQKFSLGVLLGICSMFCQFQHGVTQKSVAYKKACILEI